MPIKHYMGVDPRRDHSIRIPRPDLSVKHGTPNACINCHKDKDDAWAAEAFTKWWGDKDREPHYGEIIAAGRRGEAGSESPLMLIAGDEELPAIVRATALEVLSRRPSQESLGQTVALLGDADPTVRQSALGGLEPVDGMQRLDLAGKLLSDPVRAVRIEAARVLAAVPEEAFSPELRANFERAAAEFIRSAGGDCRSSGFACGSRSFLFGSRGYGFGREGLPNGNEGGAVGYSVPSESGGALLSIRKNCGRGAFLKGGGASGAESRDCA